MENSASMAEPVDVLICGSGSAGLCCALWLSMYNNQLARRAGTDPTKQPRHINYRTLEAMHGPLQIGKADGIQLRTVEIFESFGMDSYLKDEGYWVNEVAFWAAAESTGSMSNGNGQAKRGIVRTGRTADVQPGLSHQPHIILNQARVNELMIQRAKKLGGTDVSYGWNVKSVRVDNIGNPEYPVEVVAEGQGGRTIFRAKYVLGADGAHSQVRRSLGIPMEGDTTSAVWGVMDFYPKTTFPDLRKKCTIRSDQGTILIIPREGEFMIRTYIEMPHGTVAKNVRLEDLQEAARKIFYPYEMDFLATPWWSAYAIGQRVARQMADSSGRVFLSGDACHTHSPKAGQGMNTSLQDGYAIGWRLGAILTGQADNKLLDSYVQERHQYAKQLIEFDREFARMFSSDQTDKKISSEEFNQAFVKSGLFTAGMGSNYQDSPITAADISKSELASKVNTGRRLPSAQVVRMSDSKVFPLLKLLQSDGRWRVIIFAGDVCNDETLGRLDELGESLSQRQGPLLKFTLPGCENDAVIETLVVLHGDRTKVDFDQIHPAFKPRHHELDMMNLHKIYFDDESWNEGRGHAYESLGIDVEKGCIIVARPDQHVTAVLGLEETAVLSSVFERALRPVRK